MKQLNTNEKGQSMVEFALIVPVLLLIIIGIIEFGFLFSGYLTLSNASREVSRSVSLGANDSNATIRAKDAAVNLIPEKVLVSITPNDSNRKQGDLVTIVITYEYDFLTPFIEKLLGDNFLLRVETSVRVE